MTLNSLVGTTCVIVYNIYLDKFDNEQPFIVSFHIEP